MTKVEYKNRKYTVEPYNSDWKRRFEVEAEKLHLIFSDKAISIEHVGSTAVPELAGKPTIDIVITVEKIEIADELSEKIEGVGYKALGDYINQGSRLFVKEENSTRLINLHVFEKSHPHVKDMINLRNYFRSHPEAVEEYSKLKFDLVKKYPNDYGLYRKYKDEWMENLKKGILSPVAMIYEVSIRINFPADISEVLRKEKERFVAEYGSGYKSEPHITLYLDRYTEEGFSQLIRDIKELRTEPFAISLLEAKANLEPNRHRNLYVVDISNKEQLRQLHDKIQEIAVRYHSPFMREKTRKQLEQQGIVTDGKRENLPSNLKDRQIFDPHITLGEIDLDSRQPDLAEVRENMKNLKGVEIAISSFSVELYGKQSGEEKLKLIEKVVIPFQK